MEKYDRMGIAYFASIDAYVSLTPPIQQRKDALTALEEARSDSRNWAGSRISGVHVFAAEPMTLRHFVPVLAEAVQSEIDTPQNDFLDNFLGKEWALLDTQIERIDMQDKGRKIECRIYENGNILGRRKICTGIRAATSTCDTYGIPSERPKEDEEMLFCFLHSPVCYRDDDRKRLVFAYQLSLTAELVIDANYSQSTLPREEFMSFGIPFVISGSPVRPRAKSAEASKPKPI